MDYPAVLRYAFEKQGYCDWTRLLKVRNWHTDQLCFLWTACEAFTTPVAKGTVKSAVASYGASLGLAIPNRYVIFIVDNVSRQEARSFAMKAMRTWKVDIHPWTQQVQERMTYVQKKLPSFMIFQMKPFERPSSHQICEEYLSRLHSQCRTNSRPRRRRPTS